jgi:hypothetical protein
MDDVGEENLADTLPAALALAREQIAAQNAIHARR